MAQCYICGTKINKENETKEHILLNAIGGTLKSKTLICKNCNSDFGEKIDFELSNQLNYFSNMLNIKRDRYDVPNIELKSNSTGEEILMKPGGKPIMKINKIVKNIDRSNKKVQISISSPSIKEARKALKGLKRSYPQIDVEKALASKEVKREYLEEQFIVNNKFGGDKAFRSICKMAINFYIYNYGKKEYIEHLVPYIKGELKIPCVKFYYSDVDTILKNKNEVLHSIIIRGNNEQKLLFAYIELFNFYKCIVLLNNEYDGKDINFEYNFNVLERKKVKKDINLDITKDEINYLISHSEINFEKMKSEICKLQRIIFYKQYSKKIDSLIKEAMDNSLNKYPEDVIITSKMMNEFTCELSKKIAPFMEHIIEMNK